MKKNFTRQIQVNTKCRKLSTTDGVCALLKHTQDKYNLDLKSMGIESLEIKFQCPSLERIEDYRSGHLNAVAERYHVSQTRTKVCKPLTELLPFIPLRFYQLAHECIKSGNPVKTRT